MPTYEYRCRSCQESFTVRERMADHTGTGTLCPKCGSRDVDRVISSFYPRTPRKS
jgi:putative FmdB family regulatory protein